MTETPKSILAIGPGTFAAEYTNGGKARPATLQLVRIVDGRRIYGRRYEVTGKRHARQIAKAVGATPWNF